MTSYMIEIRQCPNCDCKFQFRVTASHNTIDAKFYTDGYVEGPMYDAGSELLRCPECKRYFWQKDVPKELSMRDSKFRSDPERRSLPHEISVGGNDYDELLDQSFWKTEDQEKYIRIRAWWSFNNGNRSNQLNELMLILYLNDSEKIEKDFDLSPKQEDNLNKLLKLLDPNDQNDSIMRAEIYRQLGKFDECLNQLDKAYDDDLRAAIETIKDLANSNNRKVGLIDSKGQETTRDDEKALYWRKKAAEQGYVAYLYGLGVDYSKGQGIPRDYKKAFYWFSLSAKLGHKDAAKKRDLIAKKLTPQQLSEAKEKAAQILKKD